MMVCLSQQIWQYQTKGPMNQQINLLKLMVPFKKKQADS